jgi:hypothetical protein
MALLNILRASVTVLSTLFSVSEALSVNITATGNNRLTTRDTLSMPKNDVFYKAPANIESYALGSVIEYRRVPKSISLTSLTPIRPKEAWQIQYRTQNSQGKAEMGIVTVLVPFNAKSGHLFVEAFFTVSLASNFQSSPV